MALSVRQLHPLFVGEVDGIKLSQTMREETVTALNQAIDQYSVLIFHDQHLDDDELLAFGRLFGSIAAPRNHRMSGRLKHGELADISNLRPDGQLRERGDHRRLDALGNQLWHSDASFRPISGALSMLHAHVVPPDGGNTEFADLRAAYDRLDAALKDSIEQLICEHSIFHSRGLLGHTDYTDEERKVLPNVKHPLLRTHPGSGRKTLYMGSHASHVVGWPMPEGRLLLRELMEHATEREFVYAHRWQKGDLVIWDNRCTLHRGRRYDDANQMRDLRRVTTQDMESISDNPELVDV
ncbi:MAG TPA: TauD/TfdA family dioxygenase [Hyphomicrobiaceae bacterium]|nr:TauD/TfdA family dioxygenase [Hyphomicrobiaceae bacterium]